MVTYAVVVALASVPGPGGRGQAQVPAVGTGEDTARAVHLLSRATWGVRPADLTVILERGAGAWLAGQLEPDRIDETGLAKRLERFPLALANVSELIPEVERRRPVVAEGDTAARRARADTVREERRAREMKSPQRILADLVGAKLTRAVHSERQLEDVMTDFWFNHFNIFFSKGLDQFLTGDYESRAIRPHVFGTFEEMLVATAEHPAMLFYLDNITSAAPDSMAGSMRGEAGQRVRPANRREPGINENYARELLELHTLGVDGGYTQGDVVDVARAFTGWTIDGGRRAGGRARGNMTERVAPRFIFRPAMHDAGEKVVLGVTLPAGRGTEDGRDVLRLLAHHPSTARFLATKLVERFVSDDGDAELTDSLTAVFLRTGGDLGEVTRALFTSDRFFAAEHRRTKVKTPFELVASTFRVTGAELGASPQLMKTLRAMGQLPYMAAAPTGYPAASADWVSTSAMLARMNFALDLAAGRFRAVHMNGQRINFGTGDGSALDRLIENVLPGLAVEPIADRIRDDLLAQPDAGPREMARRALGLVLGSPEFQQR
ncbi:MAG: DUF1800 domain-containing protein [Longimicrobiales bacterium]